MSELPPGGPVTTTPRRTLLVAVVFGGLAGWLLAVSTQALNVVPPGIPWSAPIGLLLVAALVGALAWTTHQQIQVRRQRVEPRRAVAYLVLGKASALAGALVAGGYFGFGVDFLTRLEAEGPRERVIRAVVAVLGGVALTVAGLALERACKVPEDDEEDRDPGGSR